jgi:hypothetical protein
MQVPNLIEMLSYKRPQGSRHQRKFCNRYLAPVFGKPDAHGNYILVVGDKPNICFTAHHDTVHHTSGRQVLKIEGDMVKTTGDECLGADCTTGIYIILSMIAAGVKGAYVIHSSEESGCLGSQALVNDLPLWLDNIDACISFDRKGYDSIITHQMGSRTASDAFAASLEAILDLGFKADPTGSYTDSNEYRHIVPECTNLSVGYFSQHTSAECQDLAFVEMLISALIKADWSKLVFKRNPKEVTYDNPKKKVKSYTSYDMWDSPTYFGDSMVDIVRDNPEQIVELLRSFGYEANGLLDDIENLKCRKKYKLYDTWS